MNRHRVKVYILGTRTGDIIVYPGKRFVRHWRGRVTDAYVLVNGAYLDGWRGRDDLLAGISRRAHREINTYHPVGAYINEDSACALFGCEY